MSGGATSLGVYVAQINLANPPAGTQPFGIASPLSLTVGTPEISIESAFGVESGIGATPSIKVPVLLSTSLPAGASVTVDYEILDGVTGVPPFTQMATQGPTGAVPAGTFNSSSSITITSADNLANGTAEAFISIPLNDLPQTPTTMQTLVVALTGPFTDTFLTTSAIQYILNTEPTPGSDPVTVSASAATFTSEGTGDTATITASLQSATTTDVIVPLTFTPTTFDGVVLGDQYDVTGESIVIPAGATKGLITMTATGIGSGSFEVMSGAVQGESLNGTANFLETITPPTFLAGGGGTIEGTVIGPNGEPESGVYVFLGPFLSGNTFQEFNPAYVTGTLAGLQAFETQRAVCRDECGGLLSIQQSVRRESAR